jgi:protein TonB
MVAPPAPRPVEPPPPKPVQLEEIPKPQIAQPRAIQKLVQKLDAQSPMAIPATPAPVSEAQKPPPPPEAATVAAPPQTYLSELYGHLARYKRYPRAAQLAHVEGTALLRFTLNHQGHVLAYRIERSSGHADLDTEVLAMIERAQPLPAPPANMPDPIELVIPVQFSVR